ncbi:MAG: 4Fe-4S ferredoxin [Candidatus Omnitrophica bacterium CG11_big_fil_rev_8_21_14_0_20_41_12]|nr:MAG: 4Fe-4S ferredoxin [Candidatus Omnitrophica bacterium CG11_big_fil_rev_8_21_14_0_20_41_12]
MAKRNIITIDDKKCNGCGLCIPNCPEGAIQIIDHKARLISDLFCDGLGACIGYCPEGAISIQEREAQPYNEKKVMDNIVKQGINVVKAHLSHLKEHNEMGYLKEAMEVLKEKNIYISPDELFGHKHEGQGCPGSKMMDLRNKASGPVKTKEDISSELSQWPVQLRLVPAHAPYFDGADILICADCVPFAYANFHQDLLQGKILLIGCPKLDDLVLYADKLKQIFKENNTQSVTYAHMEVPCCFGLLPVIKEALGNAGKQIPLKEITITIKGEKA